MNNDVVISVRNMSKRYKLYRTPVDRLKELIHPFRRRYHQEFWSLKDVSFELHKGEAIGVLGKNGSGKSTLLQVLSGILQPNEGEVSVKGRVSALLELGAGFDPEFTGRENVYMNGALMGLNRTEMDRRFPEIAEFAEIGDFIERPVRTYSSGMFIRLAFACAVHVDPDILLVDEVLAVGDFNFRQKCGERINEIRREATVILVSHNVRDIRMLCSRAIVLENGRMVFAGSADEATEFYLEMLSVERAKRREEKQPEAVIFGENFHNEQKITDVVYRWVDGSGEPASSFAHGEKVFVEFSFRLLCEAHNLVIGVPLWDVNGQMVTGITSDMASQKIKVSRDGIVKGRLSIDSLVLNPGEYVYSFNVRDGNEYFYRMPGESFFVGKLPVCYGLFTPVFNWEFD